MFLCIWCKRKVSDVGGWSQDKEFLCPVCYEKYQFGLFHGLIKVSASQLSKQERQEISSRLQDFKSFRRAMTAVKKVILNGKSKRLLTIFGWVLGIVTFVILGVFSKSNSDGEELIGGLLLILSAALSFFLYRGVEFLMQFLQLKKAVKKYYGN